MDIKFPPLLCTGTHLLLFKYKIMITPIYCTKWYTAHAPNQHTCPYCGSEWPAYVISIACQSTASMIPTKWDLYWLPRTGVFSELTISSRAKNNPHRFKNVLTVTQKHLTVFNDRQHELIPQCLNYEQVPHRYQAEQSYWCKLVFLLMSIKAYWISHKLFWFKNDSGCVELFIFLGSKITIP